MDLGMGQYRGFILVRNSHGSLSLPIGKRICLGEGIARNELFLFFTALLQNFSLSSPVAPEDIDLTPKESGFVKIPPVYRICFLPRWLGWGSQVSLFLLRMAPSFCLWKTCWKPDPKSMLICSTYWCFSKAPKHVLLPCECTGQINQLSLLMCEQTSGGHIPCLITSFLPIAQVPTYQLSTHCDLW